MNGSEWLAALPNLPPKISGQGRDKCVLDAAESGLLTCGWSTVKSSIMGHEAIFSVSSDALHVILDDGSRFRPQTSAYLNQKVADIFGASLCTPKIHDLSYVQADVKLNCAPFPAGAKMLTTDRSKEYNKEVEKRRAGREGLVRDTGKIWCLSNRLGEKRNISINHGFYSSGGPSVSGGVRLFQVNGGMHTFDHTDYSQTIILMSSQCLLNGEMVAITELMKDKRLSTLLSYQSVLRYSRQPGV